MKTKLFALGLCAMVAFASCSKSDDGQPKLKGALTLSESFTAKQGTSAERNGWTIQKVTGDLSWTTNLSEQGTYAQATAYKAAAGSYETWLVSPALNVRDAKEKKVNFDLMYTFFNASSTLEVYVMTDSIVAKSTSTKVDLKIPVGTDTRYGWYNQTIDLTPYVDKGYVYIGFKYTGTDVANSTYCVDNFKYNATYKKGELVTTPLDVTEITSGVIDSSLVWVKGYVVGVAVSSPSYALITSGFTSAHGTNIVLAPTANETDLNKCIPVALPTGPVRTEINLFNGTAAPAVGSQISVRGTFVKYFSKPGIKNVAEYKK